MFVAPGLEGLLEDEITIGVKGNKKINKLLNKLSQFLLCTKWIDVRLFDCPGLHHSKVATGWREWFIPIW
jgi:hypothetical protein